MYNNPFKNKVFLFLWLGAFALNIITFLVIFFKTGLHGQNVALRYTVKASVLWYGDGRNLYSLPALGLLINVLNFLLFYKLRLEEQFLLWIVSISSCLAQFLILTSLLLIASIN